jgi:hypothetical protein
MTTNLVGNVNIAIQRALKSRGFYGGSVDGILGPKSLEGIEAWIRSVSVNPTKWPKSRLLIAAEQLLYKSMDIEVGIIDGFVGPMLRNAREQYKAKVTLNWRDEAESIHEEVKPAPVVVRPTAQKVPSSTWPRQKDCMTFYGKPGSNQTTLTLPYPMRVAWNKKQIVRSWSCHEKVHANMRRIFQRTLDHYGYEKVKELGLDLWGGTLNVRKMRGGSSWSMHSWGIAVDIDPDRNALKWGSNRATLARPEYKKFWEFVYDEGAISLGIERNYDWMHFQFARL